MISVGKEQDVGTARENRALDPAAEPERKRGAMRTVGKRLGWRTRPIICADAKRGVHEFFSGSDKQDRMRESNLTTPVVATGPPDGVPIVERKTLVRSAQIGIFAPPRSKDDGSCRTRTKPKRDTNWGSVCDEMQPVGPGLESRYLRITDTSYDIHAIPAGVAVGRVALCKTTRQEKPASSQSPRVRLLCQDGTDESSVAPQLDIRVGAIPAAQPIFRVDSHLLREDNADGAGLVSHDRDDSRKDDLVRLLFSCRCRGGPGNEGSDQPQDK